MKKRHQLYVVFSLISVLTIVHLQTNIWSIEARDSDLAIPGIDSEEESRLMEEDKDDMFSQFEEVKALLALYDSEKTPKKWRYHGRFEAKMEKEFEKIYASKEWGKYNGRGYSGSGSQPFATKGYRQFLNDFLQNYKDEVTSVLDVACGLWTFSNMINWSTIDSYTGIDVVPWVIEDNKKHFGKKEDGKFKFEVGSLTSGNLPPADLLICKDVLQHLPTAVIRRFLRDILFVRHAGNSNRVCRYKYVIITNDMEKKFPANAEIKVGEWRRNTDLRLPPYNLTQLEIAYEFPVQSSHGKKSLLLDMADIGCDVYFSDGYNSNGKLTKNG